MFTKQYIRNLRDMVKKSLDSNEVYVSEIALDEVERLQKQRQHIEILLYNAEKRIEELQAERRWIPVSERLPEEDGYYIIAWKSSTWEKGKLFSIQQFYKKEYGFNTKIKYWQPIPQPPEREGES